MNNITKKYEDALTQLKSAQDLLETTQEGHEERGKAIQQRIMETRQEYHKMMIQREALFVMLTEFTKKIRAFNYGHHTGLQELANEALTGF